MSTPPPIPSDDQPPHIPAASSTPPPVPGIPQTGGPPVLPPAPGGYQSTVVPHSYPQIPTPSPALPPVSYPPVVSPQPGMSGGTKFLLFGCLGLVLLAGVILVSAMFYAGKAFKGIAQTIAQNPTRFAAEMIIKQDPELEISGSDDTKKTVTVRNKKSGEETTFSMEDLQNGKLTMKHSDGTSAELGPDGIHVKDKDGNLTDIGGVSAVKLPAWVPPYPGDHTVGLSSRQSKNGRENGMAAFTMTEDAETVAGTYQKVLEAAGFQVEVKDTTATGARVILLEGKAQGDAVGVPEISAQVMSGEQGNTVMTLKYAMKEPAVAN